MARREERLAIGHRRVRHEALEEELVDETGGAVAHRRRHLEERAEVVVDDHLAREAELLGVGVELVHGLLLGDAAVLDLAVRADGLQIADVGEAEALVLLEVGEVGGRAEARRDDRLRPVRLQELLLRDVREDAGERHRGERGLDGRVVEGARDGHAFELHALGEDALERDVAVLHRGLDRLLAHVLRERVAVDARAQRERRLQRLLRHAGLLHGHGRGRGGGLLGAVRLEDGLVEHVPVPSLGDGLRLDLRELAIADGADHGDALAFGPDRVCGDGLGVGQRLGGMFGRSGGDDGIRRRGRLALGRFRGGGGRRLGRFRGRRRGFGGCGLRVRRGRVLVVGLHDGVSFQFEFCRDCHACRAVCAHGDYGDLPQS